MSRTSRNFREGRTRFPRLGVNAIRESRDPSSLQAPLVRYYSAQEVADRQLPSSLAGKWGLDDMKRRDPSDPQNFELVFQTFNALFLTDFPAQLGAFDVTIQDLGPPIAGISTKAHVSVWGSANPGDPGVSLNGRFDPAIPEGEPSPGQLAFPGATVRVEAYLSFAQNLFGGRIGDDRIGLGLSALANGPVTDGRAPGGSLTEGGMAPVWSGAFQCIARADDVEAHLSVADFEARRISLHNPTNGDPLVGHLSGLFVDGALAPAPPIGGPLNGD